VPELSDADTPQEESEATTRIHQAVDKLDAAPYGDIVAKGTNTMEHASNGSDASDSAEEQATRGSALDPDPERGLTPALVGFPHERFLAAAAGRLSLAALAQEVNEHVERQLPRRRRVVPQRP
jgi:hypothetical protein